MIEIEAYSRTRVLALLSILARPVRRVDIPRYVDHVTRRKKFLRCYFAVVV